MKTRTLLLSLLALFAWGFTALAQQKPAGKAIVVYYSYSNNTRLLAEEIQKQAGASIFRIETSHPYPSEYRPLTEQAKKELEQGFRPPLKKRIANLSDYDIIYLGSPNWWGTIAPVVFTFLESHDFAGKTIIPFITHEGSRLGNSVRDIQRLAPKATVREGLAVRGANASKASADVTSWLQRLAQGK